MARRRARCEGGPCNGPATSAELPEHAGRPTRPRSGELLTRRHDAGWVAAALRSRPGRGVSRTRTERGWAPAPGSRRASASGACLASRSPSRRVGSASWCRSSRPGSGSRPHGPHRCRSRSRSGPRRDWAPQPGSTTLPVPLREAPRRGQLRTRPRARGMATRRMARPGHRRRSCRPPRRARRRTRVPQIGRGQERAAIGTSDLAPWMAGRWRLLADSRRCARATCYAGRRRAVSRPVTRGRATVRAPGSAPSPLPALYLPDARRSAFPGSGAERHRRRAPAGLAVLARSCILRLLPQCSGNSRVVDRSFSNRPCVCVWFGKRKGSP